ncbi:LytR family transcriptional regulator [Candidatus Parcubacteria bacterium]|jgi:LCP family protein required for cell wall assembly|nr:MAG: LytR family transcriptional regulator [Candidatus Parcubacteria bacterium]
MPEMTKSKRVEPQPADQPGPETKNSPRILLSKATEKPKNKLRIHWWRLGFIAFGIFAIAIILVGWRVLTVGTQVFHGNNNASALSQLGRLIVPGDRELKNDGNKRTNFLFVGHGGEGHDGPYLADTIIFASLDQNQNSVAMLSIPRDFLVDLPGYGYRKINNALAFGLTEANPSGGDELMLKVVESITGQKIHYYMRIDFNGFRKAVDDLGGIEVNVENSFTDYQYPTYNYGYQTIKFEAGEQHFNGEKALQFARSRHGTNGENSDFARSIRQQKLLFAFREKALTLGTLTNPGKINALLKTLGDHVSSNLELWEVLRLAEVAKNLSTHSVITRVLETGPTGLVKAATGLDGAYVLQPRIGLGNYQEIQELTKDIFILNQVAKEAAPIQIQNATSEKGLAETAATTLNGFAYEVTSVTNLKTTRYDQSFVVDLSNGHAVQTVAQLKKRYNAEVVTELPADITLQLNQNLNGNLNQNRNLSLNPPKIILVLGRASVTTVNNQAKPHLQKASPTSSI